MKTVLEGPHVWLSTFTARMIRTKSFVSKHIFVREECVNGGHGFICSWELWGTCDILWLSTQAVPVVTWLTSVSRGKSPHKPKNVERFLVSKHVEKIVPVEVTVLRDSYRKVNRVIILSA